MTTVRWYYGALDDVVSVVLGQPGTRIGGQIDNVRKAAPRVYAERWRPKKFQTSFQPSRAASTR
jgi:hypothetical protein